MHLKRVIPIVFCFLFLLCHNANAQNTNKLIFGKVFIDSIPNCTFDISEKGLNTWKLRLIRPNNDTVFATTNSTGDYQFSKSINGIYALEVLTESHYWLPCDPIKSFATSQNIDTQVNMAIKKAVNCPKMEVNILAPTLVKGQEGNYFVSYCNKGTSDANNAYIDVSFDAFMAIVSSSVVAQNLGSNRLRFQLGTVKTGDCATFSVKVKLQNNISAGLSHCVEAHIYPDNLCTPAPDFLASINGNCNSGQAEFSLQRAANQSSNIISKIKIIEEDIVLKTINDTLKNNTIKNIQVPFQLGHVYTAQVTLPNGDVIGKGIQKCDVLDTKGYLLQFTQEDGNPFTHSVCRQNEGSIKSIEKTVVPTGRKTQHFIAQNEALEYTIRFQNVVSGDTVKNVSIADTLDKALDPSSLVFGAASHLYTWSLSGKGELLIQFNNIVLPDSSKNKLASQGFISYKIKQKKNLPALTLIQNKSSIKLGNQAKKTSNIVFHTIEKPVITSTGTLMICEGEPVPSLTKTFSFPAYDSIITYNLVVLPKKKTDIAQIVCQGATGIFVTIFKAKNGCDSIVTLTVTLGTKKTTQNISICKGDSIIVGKNVYKNSGVYTDVIKTNANCDSTIITNLTVTTIEVTIKKIICFGETFNLGPKKYTQSGVFKDVSKNFKGCDSTTNLILTVLPLPKQDTLKQIKCVDDKGPFGTVYAENILKTINGCDSVVIIALAYTKSDTLKLAVTADKNNEFIYDGQKFTIKKDTIIYFEDFKNPKPCSYIKFSVKKFGQTSVDNLNISNVLLTIAPNPFSQSTKIQIENSPFHTHEMLLYDELGRLRRKEIFSGNEFLLEQKGLEKGIFLIKIVNDKWTIVQSKIVIL